MKTKISIYYDPRKKNRWIVRWFGVPDLTTGKPKRYSKAFRVKADAERFQAKQMVAFEGGKPRDRGEEHTLKELCSEWLKLKRQGSPKTAEGYEELTGRLFETFGPNISLSRIDVCQADMFIASLLTVHGDKLAEYTRLKFLKGCRAIFNKAVKWGWLVKNPFTRVEKPKNLSSRTWHYLKPGEYQKLLDAAPSLRWKALYALAYTAGLRKSELFSLRWIDIDFDNGRLTIQNQAGADTPPFKVKNGKPRTIPLPNATIEILQQLRLKAQLKVPYVLQTERQYRNLLGRWRKCREHKRRWQNRYWENNTLANLKRHVKAAGFDPNGVLCIHTLRKCAGKNWAKCVDPKTLQALMGHASIATTMEFYAKVTDDDLQKAASAIDGLLAKSDAKVTPAANLGA